MKKNVIVCMILMVSAILFFSCVGTPEILETVLVEGGTFFREDGFSIKVSSFYMGIYEVTQKQWLDVTGENLVSNKPSIGWFNYPVENIFWYDAVEFCNKLSELEGLDPCYVINGTNVTCDFEKNGYRLPTEAEWEYAARGGIHKSDFIYSGHDTVDDVAWYSDNSGYVIHEVGGKKANALGLYDMSGNVWEWCWDWYDSSSPSENKTNPTGPTMGECRVLRGGCFGNPSDYCRIANRFFSSPAESYLLNRGFRVVSSSLPR